MVENINIEGLKHFAKIDNSTEQSVHYCGTHTCTLESIDLKSVCKLWFMSWWGSFPVLVSGRCPLGLCVLVVPVYWCWVQCHHHHHHHLVGMVHHSTPGMEGRMLGDGGGEQFLPFHHSVK